MWNQHVPKRPLVEFLIGDGRRNWRDLFGFVRDRDLLGFLHGRAVLWLLRGPGLARLIYDWSLVGLVHEMGLLWLLVHERGLLGNRVVCW
jgi:hypothetical protein